MKITFIGGGNMAVALIGGLKKKGFSAAGIQVVEPGAEARERLTDSFGVRVHRRWTRRRSIAKRSCWPSSRNRCARPSRRWPAVSPGNW